MCGYKKTNEKKFIKSFFKKSQVQISQENPFRKTFHDIQKSSNRHPAASNRKPNDTKNPS